MNKVNEQVPEEYQLVVRRLLKDINLFLKRQFSQIKITSFKQTSENNFTFVGLADNMSKVELEVFRPSAALQAPDKLVRASILISSKK